jgi:IS66 C-terminal element
MAAVAIWGGLAGEDAAGYHDAIVGLNPQHYLADALARIADHPARRIAELLPWNWQPLEVHSTSFLRGKRSGRGPA